MSDAAHALCVALTVHVRLATRTKLFSAVPAGTHPAAIATPGALPVPNRRAVELAVRLARAMNAEIAGHSRWVRRHDHAPTTPRGYRLTQSDAPLARRGVLAVAAHRLEVSALRLAEDDGEPDAPHRAGDARVELDVAPFPLDRDAQTVSACLEHVRALATAVGLVSTRDDVLPALVHLTRRTDATTLLGITTPAALARALDLALAPSGAPRPGTFRYDRASDRLTPLEPTLAHAALELPDPDLPPLHLDPAWLAQLAATPSHPPPT